MKGHKNKSVNALYRCTNRPGFLAQPHVANYAMCVHVCSGSDSLRRLWNEKMRATKTLVTCCKQVIIYPSFEGIIRSNDKGPYELISISWWV